MMHVRCTADEFAVCVISEPAMTLTTNDHLLTIRLRHCFCERFARGGKAWYSTSGVEVHENNNIPYYSKFVLLNKSSREQNRRFYCSFSSLAFFPVSDLSGASVFPWDANINFKRSMISLLSASLPFFRCSSSTPAGEDDQFRSSHL